MITLLLELIIKSLSVMWAELHTALITDWLNTMKTVWKILHL